MDQNDNIQTDNFGEQHRNNIEKLKVDINCQLQTLIEKVLFYHNLNVTSNKNYNDMQQTVENYRAEIDFLKNEVIIMGRASEQQKIFIESQEIVTDVYKQQIECLEDENESLKKKMSAVNNKEKLLEQKEKNIRERELVLEQKAQQMNDREDDVLQCYNCLEEEKDKMKLMKEELEFIYEKTTILNEKIKKSGKSTKKEKYDSKGKKYNQETKPNKDHRHKKSRVNPHDKKIKSILKKRKIQTVRFSLPRNSNTSIEEEPLPYFNHPINGQSDVPDDIGEYRSKFLRRLMHQRQEEVSRQIQISSKQSLDKETSRISLLSRIRNTLRKKLPRATCESQSIYL